MVLRAKRKRAKMSKSWGITTNMENGLRQMKMQMPKITMARKSLKKKSPKKILMLFRPRCELRMT
jgi:hypothetical protein